MSKNKNKKGGKTVVAVAESGTRNKKFLDFAISTSNTNSGIQQYGAGQQLKGRSRSRNADPQEIQHDMPPMAGINLGTLGHINSKTSDLGVKMEQRCEVLQNADGTDFKFSVDGIGFETRTFNINAGLKTLKWASSVFGGFEKYEVLDLKFEYVPAVSGFNGAGEAGTIVFLFNYDSLEGPPLSMGDAMTYSPSVLTMPSVSALLDVDAKLCTPKEGKYVRSGPVAGDLKTYDAGSLHICTEGISSTQEFGHVLVHYRFRAIKARVNPPALSYFPSATTLVCDMTLFPVGSFVVIGSPASNGAWAVSPGTAALLPPNLGNLPIGLDAATGTLHFPQGRYLCDLTFRYGANLTTFDLHCDINPVSSSVGEAYYINNCAANVGLYPFSMSAPCPLVVTDPLGANVKIVMYGSTGTAGATAAALLVIRHLTASLTY